RTWSEARWSRPFESLLSLVRDQHVNEVMGVAARLLVLRPGAVHPAGDHPEGAGHQPGEPVQRLFHGPGHRLGPGLGLRHHCQLDASIGPGPPLEFPPGHVAYGGEDDAWVLGP